MGSCGAKRLPCCTLVSSGSVVVRLHAAKSLEEFAVCANATQCGASMSGEPPVPRGSSGRYSLKDRGCLSRNLKFALCASRQVEDACDSRKPRGKNADGLACHSSRDRSQRRRKREGSEVVLAENKVVKGSRTDRERNWNEKDEQRMRHHSKAGSPIDGAHVRGGRCDPRRKLNSHLTQTVEHFAACDRPFPNLAVDYLLDYTAIDAPVIDGNRKRSSASTRFED